MRYRDVADAQERWRGLALDVERGSPALRIEIAKRHRMRLSSQGSARLWSCVVSGYQGVWLLRAPGRASPGVVPPIRADEVRAAPEPGLAWWRHWARHAAGALLGGEHGPLGRGRWVLRPAELVDDTLPRLPPACREGVEQVGHVYGRLAEFVAEGPRYETWGINGSHALFALRDPSPPDAARVKAWRKAAAAGAPLPPGVALSVTGMDMFALLDGHDRLIASALDRRPLALLLLEREGTPREPPPEVRREAEAYLQARREEVERRLERAAAEGAGTLAIERLSREYAHLASVEPFSTRHRSACAPLPGGAPRWEAEVRARLAALGVAGEHPMLRNAMR